MPPFFILYVLSGSSPLRPDIVRDGYKLNCGRLLKIHDSGWVVLAELKEDYYEWVNEFEAYHKDYGCVCGDFEETVNADSEEAFQHFYKHHKPHSWDYGDI